MLAQLEREYPIERIAVDVWLDLQTGEELGLQEVTDKYGIPLESRRAMADMPEDLREALENQTVHFIETQRLLRTHHSPPRRRHGADPRTERSTVLTYATDLREKLDAALAMNSRASQEFDRSFPRRILLERPQVEPEDELRRRYAEQLELRSRLAGIAILDSFPPLELPERKLSGWERKVLHTYLNDTAAKLETFQPLLDRLELLRTIVNERFLFKSLEFDRERGFTFYDEDSEFRLDPQELSSGEQHELVVMYAFLMNVQGHSLVLIDEPEISLHVAWQQEFLNDIGRIADVTSLRFIIATHSPQIIGSWWDRTVSLYSSE